MVGSRINYVHNFILHNVNGWNYPTSVNVTGSTELRVQSLHLDQTVDASFATGDVVVDVANSTCISQSSISPYDICTYTIQSGGNEGKLHLSPTEFIVINEGDTGEEANSGSAGGATSLWMILGMLLTGYIRKRAAFFKVRVI
ncbi:hypothetical protein [Vibrio taketomensis]|uniref:hypothetical protein n=1 Tax=Vibrio taketomensis TaxID=2572923 RepID=UPI00138960F4|nr:hypothetical protein [Vibrio taketomensis]